MTLLDQLARQAHRRSCRVVLLLAALLLLLSLLSLCAGELWLTPDQWFTPQGELFVWQLRLPRTLAVIATGAALALCGTVMQALFNNPLAEPGLLGVSNGAGIGLVLGVLLGSGSLWSLAAAAMAGALVITLILLHFAYRQLSSSRLLLVGVALGIICSAMMTWAVYFSSTLDLRQLMYWMMGGFGGVDWRYGWLIASLVPVTGALLASARPLNLLALGEIPARQLGLPLLLWRNLLVLAMGWLVGVSVALAGAIGFIGLVVPHLLRLCGITDHRYLLHAAALAGAAVLLAADIVARLLLTSAELPIGVVTATLGAPLFILLLIKSSR